MSRPLPIRYRIFRLACAQLVFTFFFGSTLLAQTVGQVTALSGSAQLQRGSVTSAVTNAMPVELHDRFTTGAGSAMSIGLRDGSTLQVSESSSITIDEQVMGPGGVRQSTRVGLLTGRLYAIVSATLHAGTPTFQVNTPNAVAGARGTRFSVSFADSSPVCGASPSSDVGVDDGAVGVANASGGGAGGVVISAGYETVICDGHPPLPPGPLGLAGDGTGGGGGAASGYSGSQPGTGAAPPPACPVCPACTGPKVRP